MQEVKYVQKDATVQGYKAVTHDQLVSNARQSLVDNGVAIAVSQIDGEIVDTVGKMRLYRGKYSIKAVNIDTPSDYIPLEIEAHAFDNGDKAPGKCATYATKTAILKLLWLETGENDESRTEVKEVINKEQCIELAKLINNNDKLWNSICSAYKIDKLEMIKESKFNEVKARIVKYNENIANRNNN